MLAGGVAPGETQGMPALRALLVAMLAMAFFISPAAARAAADVRPADAFVDSIGVNVHMTYGDTAYRDRDRLVDKLAQAGIRHVRDGLSWNTDYAYDTFNEMADRGIHTTFIMGDPSERRDTLDQLLTALRTKVSRAAEAVEGPNEYSHSGDPLWSDHLRAYQERLYTAVKDDPSLNKLPVIGPSLITWQDYAQLGDLTDAEDFGNKHSYPGGDNPEGNVDNELSVAAKVSDNQPVSITESGYHNALATDSGHRPASEAAAASYIPRMYLEYFRKGVPRTFSYELVDEWADPDHKNLESNFGLLRNDYSEKPAFHSLTNLIELLADPGGGDHQATPLDYSIVGGPSDLRQLVLQKRDGTYELVLWRAVQVWDPQKRERMTPDTKSLVVQVDGASAGSGEAKLFSPVDSTAPVAKLPVAEGIPVSLAGDPIVIELSPGLIGPPEDVAPSDQCVAPRSTSSVATGGRTSSARKAHHHGGARKAHHRRETAPRALAESNSCSGTSGSTPTGSTPTGSTPTGATHPKRGKRHGGHKGKKRRG